MKSEQKKENLEFSYELKIPKERVAVLIGQKGEIKKKLEEETKSKIDIDSKEGEIKIIGDDALGLYAAREIITAIGRGFNPDFAFLLLRPDFSFVAIDLREFSKTQKSMKRLKGRIIGAEGKSRRTIEELTETYICVYGKTVSIIGLQEDTMNANNAIEMLLKGSPHGNVYKWLEKKRRERKQKEVLGGIDWQKNQ